MAKRTDDEALLREIRDRYDRAHEAWSEIRDEADVDMRFVGGDPWDPKDRRAREDASRPCLSLDELNQYFNQAINEVRANPLAMRFSPRGGGASEKGAQFYQDKAREIEYRSRATQAYTTAFENAIQRSYGWVRLLTKWVEDVTDDPFRQQIWVEPVANPNQITPDPDFLRPDGADLRYLFVEQQMPYDEFARDYPDAHVRGFDGAWKAAAPKWYSERSLTLAEYWTVEVTTRTLYAVQGRGGAVSHYWEGELPKGAKPVKERPVEQREVWSYLTNGVEILKRTKWAGKYIPFACCLGKVLWTTDSGQAKRTILSMTRLARDPQMLYAYYRTCEAELVGMAPKFPYFAYRGSLDAAQKRLIEQSLHEPVAVIEVEPTPDGVAPNTVLPMPQRQPYEPPIAALEMGAEAARRAIQSAMGISPLPTDAQRRNQKSGVALEQIESSQQKGSYHFKDHYIDMVTQVAVMVEDLIDKIHDTATETAVRRQDETSAMVRINDPDDPEAISTQGDYLVTVSAGPSYESTRREAADFLDKIAGIPQVFPLVASEIVRLKQLGPEGDRIAEILEMLKPPQVQQMLAAKKQGGDPDPQALLMQLQQQQAQIGQAEQVMQQLKQELDIQAAKQQADLKKAEIDRDTKLELQRMQDATSIAVAQINASTKVGMAQDQAQLKVIALDATAAEAEAARAHEAQMAQMGHQQALEQQEQAGAQQAQLAEQPAQMAAPSAAGEISE